MIRVLQSVVAFAVLAAFAGHASASITVGSATLTPCVKRYDGYCGSITRPLDPSGKVGGTIIIGFEFYPHPASVGKSIGTIIAQEGGPGDQRPVPATAMSACSRRCETVVVTSC